MKIRRYASMYWLMAKSTFRVRTSYRFNFIVSLNLQGLMYFSELLAVVLIVNRVHDIGGWGLYDLLFLYGLLHVGTGFARVIAAELKSFDKYLIEGQFDALLVRPVPALVAVMGKSFDLEHLGQSVQGLIVLCISWRKLHVPVDFLHISATLIAVLSGALIWFAIMTATATIGFWTQRIDDLQPVLLYGPETASAYPLSIYPKAIQAVFYSLLPIAFGAYIPASAILHHGMPMFVVVGSFVVSIFASVAAVLFWSYGVRHYTSTGT